MDNIEDESVNDSLSEDTTVIDISKFKSFNPAKNICNNVNNINEDDNTNVTRNYFTNEMDGTAQNFFNGPEIQ